MQNTKNLHTVLLPVTTSSSADDETFQESYEEENTFSIPLITLQTTQSQQHTLQNTSSYGTFSHHSLDDKVEELNTASPKPTLPASVDDDKNKDESKNESRIDPHLFSLNGLHPTAQISLNRYEFLQKLNINGEELSASGIDNDIFVESINKNLSRRILRWLALERFLVKILQYSFLDERGIQDEKIVPKSKGFCDQAREWTKTRVWPRAASIPFKSEKVLRIAYGVSEFFAGTEVFINRVWSLLLLTFLSNDLYYYYTFPDERYDTTLITIFFTQSQNEEMLSTSLASNYVWPELFALPIVWGIYNAVCARSYVRDFNSTNREETVKKLLLLFENYKPSLVNDIFRWLLPINKLSDNLELVQRTLLWDNRLSPEMRLALFTALKSFIRRSRKLTQLSGIATLNILADSIASSDFLRMKRNNVDKATLLSYLAIKTESIAELQSLAKTYRLEPHQEDSYYARYMQPFMRYVMAHYALWCLGLTRTNALQPFFWLWKMGKLYVQFRFIYTISNGIYIIVQRYLDKISCESQGKIWMYMDQVADYVCSVCGDFKVFFGSIFSMQNCLDELMENTNNFDIKELIRLLERSQPSDGIKVLDFINQTDFGPDEACRLSSILPKLSIQTLSFYRPVPYHHIGNNGTECLALALPNSNVQTLHLGYNDITDASMLMSILAKTPIRTLNFSGNRLVTIDAIASGLPDSQVMVLDLSYNNIIVNISGIAKALPKSKLHSLYLSYNKISNTQCLVDALSNSTLITLDLGAQNYFSGPRLDINYLGKALKGSNVQNLDLRMNRIVNITPIAQVLPDTAIKNLNLFWNSITDISPFTTLLRSSLQSLRLDRNQIENINALVDILPGSNVSSLNLANNHILNISSLIRALPGSNVRYLNLALNGIANVDFLAAALPGSKVQTLDLSSNMIIDISVFGQGLVSSSLNSLNLALNQIVDVGSLEHGLIGSVLQSLDLSQNFLVNIEPIIRALPHSNLTNLSLCNENRCATGINISALANTLKNSKLQFLDLSADNIFNIDVLAQALPGSNLKVLNLQYNAIANISSLAVALPGSNLRTLLLSNNNIVNITAFQEGLIDSPLETLDLTSNSISDTSAFEVLPFSSLQSLYLANNHITNNLKALVRALPKSNLQNLNLAQNGITDVTFFKDGLPGSTLNRLDLGDNEIASGVLSVAEILTTKPHVKHTLWLQSIDNNERRALAHATPNTNLQEFKLNNNELNTSESLALCRVFPYTKIVVWDLGGNNIDSSVVDPTTCYISEASSLSTPFFIRLPYQAGAFIARQLSNAYDNVASCISPYPVTCKQQNDITIFCPHSRETWGKQVQQKYSNCLVMTDLVQKNSSNNIVCIYGTNTPNVQPKLSTINSEAGALSIIGSAVLEGAAYAVIPEALGDILQLCNILGAENAEYVKNTANLALIALSGSWVATGTSWLTRTVLQEVGVNLTTARTVGNSVAVAINVAKNLNPVSIAATMFSLVAGKFGFWAEKKVVHHFSTLSPTNNASATCYTA